MGSVSQTVAEQDETLDQYPGAGDQQPTENRQYGQPSCSVTGIDCSRHERVAESQLHHHRTRQPGAIRRQQRFNCLTQPEVAEDAEGSAQGKCRGIAPLPCRRQRGRGHKPYPDHPARQARFSAG